MKIEGEEGRKLYVPLRWIWIMVGVTLSCMSASLYVGKYVNSLEAQEQQSEIRRVYLETKVTELKELHEVISEHLYKIDRKLGEIDGRLQSIERHLK